MRAIVFVLVVAALNVARAESVTPTTTPALRLDGDRANEIERAAARKRYAGVALMSSGAAANVLGIALWASFLKIDMDCGSQHLADPVRSGACPSHDGAIAGGLVTAGIGLIAAAVGVGLYVKGVRERRAEGLRVALDRGGLRLRF
jgi:hypothetical protein